MNREKWSNCEQIIFDMAREREREIDQRLRGCDKYSFLTFYLLPFCFIFFFVLSLYLFGFLKLNFYLGGKEDVKWVAFQGYALSSLNSWIRIQQIDQFTSNLFCYTYVSRFFTSMSEIIDQSWVIWFCISFRYTNNI